MDSTPSATPAPAGSLNDPPLSQANKLALVIICNNLKAQYKLGNIKAFSRIVGDQYNASRPAGTTVLLNAVYRHVNMQIDGEPERFGESGTVQEYNDFSQGVVNSLEHMVSVNPNRATNGRSPVERQRIQTKTAIARNNLVKTLSEKQPRERLPAGFSARITAVRRARVRDEERKRFVKVVVAGLKDIAPIFTGPMEQFVAASMRTAPVPISSAVADRQTLIRDISIEVCTCAATASCPAIADYRRYKVFRPASP